MLIIREGAEQSTNAVGWVTENCRNITAIGSKAFSKALYEGLHWNMDYKFKFRGITKQRGKTKFIMFNLDEPQILMERRVMEDVTAPNRYINHKVSEDLTVYPKNWNDGQVRFSYELHQKRNEIINLITESDILESGTVAVNPMLGNIPSREEVSEELTKLLECM